MDEKLLESQYKNHLSNYQTWEQKDHSDQWVLFPQNIGPGISIDETSLSRGELYTIITNKSAKGQKGSLIAMVKGTDVQAVCSVLMRMPRRIRWKVKEVTLDMASNMELIVRKCFPPAVRVTDRFHVQKLAYDAVQEMRIKERWKAIDAESTEIAYAKACAKSYQPLVFENGDTRKQLLARSRYLLFKKETLWGTAQKQRANILFSQYPNIKKAYYLAQQLGLIYQQSGSKPKAYMRLARWYDQVDRSGFLEFGTVARTIQIHYTSILNYFDNRSTNASAESFNAKIKAFRTLLRGVRDIKFFIFRVTKIYA